MARNANTIYSATYSNVPVYEFNVEGNHVMRRRSDDWINATHILKVADYDKPARTRILEREVQKGVHEKVQGGYGKYQGTWIPLEDGKALATKNGVVEKLAPIFEFVPGDHTPPPAPKHATAASSKPRVPRASATRKAAPAATYQPVDYESMDISMQEPGTPGADTIDSTSVFDDYDASQFTNSRKRRRTVDPISQADIDHRLWADELLDYFMLQDQTHEGGQISAPPLPQHVDLNRPIDDRGHTALHWAAAIADIEIVKNLIRNGASVDAQSKEGETPLMRAVLFVNSFDKRNMEKLAAMLITTVNMQEWFGGSVFHHIAAITASKKKYECARYYMDCILNKMTEVLAPNHIERILNEQDHNGDTAIMIAARNGARKCVRSLLGRNAGVSIPNAIGETADGYIVQLNHRRQERSNNRQLSSSPFQADSTLNASRIGGAVMPPNGIPFDPLVPHTSLNGTGSSPNSVAQNYKSDAALTLMSKTMPEFMTKIYSMTSAIDQEFNEKGVERSEAERLLAMRQAEIEQTQQEQEKLRIKELEQTSGGIETDTQLAKELEDLEKECEGLVEAEEVQKLRELLNSEFKTVPNAPDTRDQDTVAREKFTLLRELMGLQQQRGSLMTEMIGNLSVAGLGDKQDLYKQLITGALGIRMDEVEGMLPEIVNELEDWKGLEAAGA